MKKKYYPSKKSRLGLRKYILPVKISLKKRIRSIIIWDWTKV